MTIMEPWRFIFISPFESLRLPSTIQNCQQVGASSTVNNSLTEEVPGSCISTLNYNSTSRTFNSHLNSRIIFVSRCHVFPFKYIFEVCLKFPQFIHAISSYCHLPITFSLSWESIDNQKNLHATVIFIENCVYYVHW